MDRTHFARLAGPLIAAFAGLTGCGGGGGDGGGFVPPPPTQDRTAPSVPTGLAVSATTVNSLTLNWNASTDNTGGSGLAGYRIYRDGSMAPTASVTATTYTDSGLAPQTGYSYTVSAYDNAGNESAAAGAVTGTTQTPPAGNVTVTGQVTFDRPSYTQNNTLNFNALERLPVRGARVEILRSSDQSLLASTTTDATSGSYSAAVPAGSIIVRVKAQLVKTGSGGYDFEVRNNTSNNALYSLDSAIVSLSGSSARIDLNAATGWGGSSYTGPRAAAPFAILDMLWRARQLIQGAEASLEMPALDVFWSSQNTSTDCADGRPDPTTGDIGTTSYVGGTIPAAAGCAATPRGIYVLGDASNDSDEFDSSVIAHEFGHYYQDEFSRDDSMGGPWSIDTRFDLRLAMSEGWGNAFQGFVLDSPWYRDTFGTGGAAAFAFDMERDSFPFQNSIERGFFGPASVQDFLWDVYDAANEGGDQIDLGFGPIHTVMRNDMVSTDAMTSLYVMASGLETRNPSQQNPIRSRLQLENVIGQGDFAVGEAAVGPGRGWPADSGAVPVYNPVTFGQPVTVVSTDRFADSGDDLYEAYNRLGGRRYLRIDLPGGGGLRITAQGPVGSDPDFYLYRDGVDQCRTGTACIGDDVSVSNGLEEASYSGLAAGTYVLEVEECSNLGQVALCQQAAARGDTTIDVTVTQQ